MKRYIGLAFTIYVVWALLFMLEKPVFLVLYLHSLEALGPVVRHGAILDFAMAGYLSVLPFLALVIKPYVSDHAHRWFLRVYFAVVSLAVALSFVANLALYGYWQFPLDATPLFYFYLHLQMLWPVHRGMWKQEPYLLSSSLLLSFAYCFVLCTEHSLTLQTTQQHIQQKSKIVNL